MKWKIKRGIFRNFWVFKNLIWREQRSSAKLSVKNQAIMEEKDSPLSTNSSTIRLLKKKKDLIFLNKEDKIKLAVTKCFGGLA